MKFVMKITGDAEIDRKLNRVNDKIGKKAMRKATREAAKVVLADAKKYAPHDSGDLERSLTVRTAKKNNGRGFGRHTFGHAVATRAGMFAGDEFYGGFVEFGTKPRRTGAGHFRGSVDETAFMREALYTNRMKVNQIFKQRTLAAIRELST